MTCDLLHKRWEQRRDEIEQGWPDSLDYLTVPASRALMAALLPKVLALAADDREREIVRGLWQ